MMSTEVGTVKFTDRYPGKPKILFVGLACSSHTHGWIDLISKHEMNIRLFGTPNDGIPPKGWQIPTYLTTPNLPTDLDTTCYSNLYPIPKPEHLRNKEPQNTFSELKNLLSINSQGSITIEPLYYRPKRTFFATLGLFCTLPIQFANALIRRVLPQKYHELGYRVTPEKWLKMVIEQWQPDIIHTLGVFDQQGGEFFQRVIKEYDLHYKGKWVVQLRGGSDLALRHCDPKMKDTIRDILTTCDYIISDNIINIQIAENLGIPREKFAHISPIPGSGGVDIESIATQSQETPSNRRIIIFPKAYDATWSKATSVLEALKICWDQIQPCNIYLMKTSAEIRSWLHTLPADMQTKFIDFDMTSREKFFSLLTQSRVMLAPSLVDGIPNSLYEAMAAGAFPIVSPLDTIRTVVTEPQNVLFARNLYPEEIAAALVRAMNDDELVDQAAKINLEKARLLAEKKNLAQRVAAFYLEIVK